MAFIREQILGLESDLSGDAKRPAPAGREGRAEQREAELEREEGAALRPL